MKLLWHVLVQTQHVGLHALGRLGRDFDATLQDGDWELGMRVR